MITVNGRLCKTVVYIDDVILLLVYYSVLNGQETKSGATRRGCPSDPDLSNNSPSSLSSQGLLSPSSPTKIIIIIIINYESHPVIPPALILTDQQPRQPPAHSAPFLRSSTCTSGHRQPNNNQYHPHFSHLVSMRAALPSSSSSSL